MTHVIQPDQATDVRTASAAPGRMRRWLRIAAGLARGYAIALGFLGALVLTIIMGGRFAPSLGEPRWALFVAVVLVLPIVGPWLARNVAPRLKVLKIADIAEFEFADVDAKRLSLGANISSLSESSGETRASEFAGMMSSLSGEIMATVERLELTEEEVLVVDLRVGRSWVLPNLYFLALLVRRRTRVQQIAFVETRHVDGVFVCMCTPGELLAAVERLYPVLRQAASTLTYDELMGVPPANPAMTFFSQLSQLYMQQNANQQVKDLWLSSPVLFSILGAHAHRDAIAWHENVSEADHLEVLRSTYPYTAALDDGALLFLISRDRLALAIARHVARQHAA
jgi:hypothetical protein